MADTDPVSGAYDSFAGYVASKLPEQYKEAEAAEKKAHADDQALLGQARARGKQIMENYNELIDTSDQPKASQFGIDENTGRPAKPPEYNETPPLQAFGSMASTLAIFGSMFTRRPLVNALNSSAAAMNAIQQNDYRTFQIKSQEAQQQSDYAAKLAEWQYKRYQTAYDQYKNKKEEQRAALQALYAADNNMTLQHTLETQGADASMASVRDQMNWLERFNTARQGLTADKIEAGWLQEQFKAIDAGQGTTEQKMEAKKKIVADFERMRHPERPQSALQLAMNAYIEQYRAAHNGQDPPADAMSQFYVGLTKTSGKQSEIADAMRRYEEEYKAAHGGQAPPYAEWRDEYLRVTKGKSPDDAARLQAKQKADEEYKNRLLDITEKFKGSDADLRKAMLDEKVRHDKELEGLGLKRVQSADDRFKETMKLRQDTLTEVKRWHDLVASGKASAAEKKQAAKADELAALMGQIDSIQDLVTRNSTVAGAMGTMEWAWNATGGQVLPGFQDERSFREKMKQLQTMFQSRFLNSKYFSGKALSRMEELVPGLGVEEGPDDTLTALQELKKTISGQIKDGVPAAEESDTGPPMPDDFSHLWK